MLWVNGWWREGRCELRARSSPKVAREREGEELYALLSQPTRLTLPPASITDPDLLDDPKVRKRHQMA